MPDQKISQLQSMSAWSANDLLLVIDSGTTNVSKQATLKEFSKKALQNTVVNGTLSSSGNTVFQSNLLVKGALSANSDVTFHRSVVVANNHIQIANTFTPASSSIDMGMGVRGVFTWDSSYIYVQVSANTVKRIPLQTF